MTQARFNKTLEDSWNAAPGPREAFSVRQQHLVEFAGRLPGDLINGNDLSRSFDRDLLCAYMLEQYERSLALFHMHRNVAAYWAAHLNSLYLFEEGWTGSIFGDAILDAVATEDTFRQARRDELHAIKIAKRATANLEQLEASVATAREAVDKQDDTMKTGDAASRGDVPGSDDGRERSMEIDKVVVPRVEAEVEVERDELMEEEEQTQPRAGPSSGPLFFPSDD